MHTAPSLRPSHPSSPFLGSPDMQVLPSLPLRVAATMFLAAVLTAGLPGQAVNPAPGESANPDASASANDHKKEEEVVVMDVFTVERERDHGYQATSTLAGSRMATLLKETPAVISVLTKEFMDDVGVTDISELASWGPNVYVDEVDTNSAYTESLVNFGRPVVTRGISSNQGRARNYFISIVPGDVFETEAIEIARGPNAALYGDGSLGGLVSTATKRAKLQRDFAKVEVKPDSWGGIRTSMDTNASMGRFAALRANFLYESMEGWRDAQYSERRATQISATFRPFKRTQLFVEYSGGHGESSAPRENFKDMYSTYNPNWDWSDTTRLKTDYSSSINGPYYTAAEYALLANNQVKYAWDTSDAPVAADRVTANVAPADVGIGRNVGTVSPHLVFMSNNDPYNPARSIPLMNWADAVRSSGLGTNYPIYPTQSENAAIYTGRENYPMSLPSREYSHTPSKTPLGESDWYLWGAYLTQSIGNLAIEVGMNLQHRDSSNFLSGINEVIYYDLNEYLPERKDALTTGTNETAENTNPNAGRAFTDTHYARAYSRNWAKDFRLMLAYPLRLGFMEQRIVGILGRREEYTDYTTKGWVRTNNGSIDTDANRVYVRRYLDDGDAPILSEPRSFGAYEVDYLTYDRSLSKTRMNYMQAAMQGRYWDGILSTTLGIRHDDYKQDLTDRINGRGGIGDPTYDPGTGTWSYVNPSTIAINPSDPANNDVRFLWRGDNPVRANDGDPTNDYPSSFGMNSAMAGVVLWPVKWLGLFANYSEGFTSAAKANDIHGNPIEQPRNKGVDLGLKFELFDGKISGRIGYYKSKSRGANSSFANGLADSFATNTNGSDMWDRAKEIYLSAYNATQEQQWLDKYDRAEQLDAAMRAYVDSIDIDANGWELDFTLNPTRAWAITLNGALTDNAQNNAMPDTKAYWNEHLPEWLELANTEAGHAGAYNATVAGRMSEGIAYVDMVLRNKRDGRPLNGTPDYTANIFTSYTFLYGPLKGLRVGAGAQFIGPRILGIKKYWDPDVRNGVPDADGNPTDKNAAGQEVPRGYWREEPGYGYKTDSSVLANAMLRYTFKLWRREFVLQLNISNLLGFDEYIYSGGVGNATASMNYNWAQLDEHGMPVKKAASAKIDDSGTTTNIQYAGGAQIPTGFRYSVPRKFILTLSTSF
ncbi:TonB-dependent receptor plug domain-containing protein [Termitidicoccus mucosus]|uniref:TonB-dependent receptor plug domain-containing protein n=1 Tax=Termitidicoccus mucosus TaxID=1184151 RepID=A0A178IL63_9BACT|nr:hypothetical protein AW736_07375 [Opitutaceae bacterium TSB47]